MALKLFFVCSSLLLVSQATSNQSIGLKPTLRVFGGFDAAKREFPYTVSLQIVEPKSGKKEHECGGSILNERWILTAAHCVNSTIAQPNEIFVVAGSNNLDPLEKSAQIVSVAFVIVHDFYGKVHGDGNDIALLKLQTPLTLNRDVGPVKLPRRGANPTGKGIISGWGSDRRDGVGTVNTLQKLNVSIVDYKACNRWVATNPTHSHYFEPLVSTEICTLSDINDPISSCGGDSGGPLVQRRGSRPDVIVGIVSWGANLCYTAPSVYVDVAQFIDWIETTMKTN